jgi:predicted enzyme related to lactoylglutathione lyase
MEVEIILYVMNQGISKAFYAKLLGKDPELDVPGMTEFQMSGTCKLGLMPNSGIAGILGNKTPHPDAGIGIPRCELYLKVKDVEMEFEKAVASGALLVSPLKVRDWGDKVGYLADPDGHIIALAEACQEQDTSKQG